MAEILIIGVPVIIGLRLYNRIRNSADSNRKNRLERMLVDFVHQIEIERCRTQRAPEQETGRPPDYWEEDEELPDYDMLPPTYHVPVF